MRFKSIRTERLDAVVPGVLTFSRGAVGACLSLLGVTGVKEEISVVSGKFSKRFSID